MSKFVDEIIKDLKDNPHTFRGYTAYLIDRAVEKGNIRVEILGSYWFSSTVWIYIGDNKPPITGWDSLKLQRAVDKWYKSVSLATLTK